MQDLQWAPAAPRQQDVIEGGDSSSVATGSGGPISGGVVDFRSTCVWCRMRFPEDYPSGVGSGLAIGIFWYSSESPTVLGMGWCSGIGKSSGDGTGTVARYAVQGSGDGGGHPATSRCVPHDNELGNFRSIHPLIAGTVSEIL